MTWTEVLGSPTPTSAIIPYASFIRVDSSPYNAAGDGKVITDAAMTINTATLTSASAPFSSSDVGKLIRVETAGNAGGTIALSTTILSYTSSTTVTLASNALKTISSQLAAWGTNDTTNIQAAVDAAKYASSSNNGSAAIVFGDGQGTPKIYCVNDTIDFGTSMDGLTVTSYGWGYTNGNATGGYHQVQIRWLGADATTKPIFWFKEGSIYDTVSNLGFTGGDEAIRFRKTDWADASLYTLGFGRVRGCHFDDQRIASVQIGGPLTGGNPTAQDDMNDFLIEDCYFSRTHSAPGHGVVANMGTSGTNGYALKIRDCQFPIAAITGAQAVYCRGWNDISIHDVGLSAAGGTFNTLYPFYIEHGSGFIDLYNVYAEAPLVLQTDLTGTQAYTRGTSISNLVVNTSDTDTKPALSLYSYTTLMNVAVSTGTVQRTVAADRGLVVIATRQNGTAGNDLYAAIGGGAITHMVCIGGGTTATGTRFTNDTLIFGTGTNGPDGIQFRGGCRISGGAGTPLNAVYGNPGDMFLRTDGGAATSLYVKESGADDRAGWVGK